LLPEYNVPVKPALIAAPVENDGFIALLNKWNCNGTGLFFSKEKKCSPS
jgi:hypothetical protein